MSNSVPLPGEADKEIGAGFAPLTVTAQDIPNLTVKIRAGSFWNADDAVVQYPGGNSPSVPPPSSLFRWTVVSLSSAGSVVFTHGTASAAPSIPAVAAGLLPLAAIYMGSTTTQITSVLIQDVRPLYDVVDTVPNLAAELADRPTFADVANDLALKADIDGTPSSVFYLNKGAVTPANANLLVDRSALPDVSIRWNEGTMTWQFTNNGVTFVDIASVSGTFMDLVASPTVGHVLTVDALGQAIDSGTLLSALATTSSVTSSLALKADKVIAAVNGDLASLNASGNLVDSGILASSLTGLAHLAGVETFTGAKTFTSNVTVATGPVANPSLIAGVFGGTDMGIEVTRAALPANPAIVKWDEASGTWQVGIVGVSVDTILTNVVLSDYVKADGTVPMTGALQLAAGTAAAPSLTFSGATNKGMYDSGLNELSFATNGTSAVVVDDTLATFSRIPVLPQHLVGSLPTGVPGGMIYVTDATPDPAMCFYNGTDWIDVVTGVAVV